MKVIYGILFAMLGVAYGIRIADIPDDILRKKVVSLTVPYKTYIQTLNADAVQKILNDKIIELLSEEDAAPRQRRDIHLNPSAFKNMKEVEIDEDDEIREARAAAQEIRKKRGDSLSSDQKPYLIRTNLQMIPLF